MRRSPGGLISIYVSWRKTWMLNFRTLLFAGAFGLATAGAANAQDVLTNPISLAGFLPSTAVTRAYQAHPGAGPFVNLSVHGGAMVSPRGAGLAGVDVDVPSVSLGNGWHGRVDADAIIKANFGGIDTVFPVTLDQVYYSPNAAGGHNVYWGAGLGAVLNGPVVFDGKLLIGTEVTTRIGA